MEVLLYILILIIVFAIGANFGSFLNVVIYRLPKKESFISGSSYCPHCEHKLMPLDLVPIFSYLFLGRKCRYCKEPISPRYLLIETLTGVLALGAYLAFMPPVAFMTKVDATELPYVSAQEAGLMASWLPFDIPAFIGALIATLIVFTLLCVLVVVTFVDSDTMEIPNSLPLWVAVLGLLGIFLGPTATLPWYDHLIGAFAISVPLLLMAFILVGSFGLGDVKLMAAAGLFLGWQLALAAAFIGIIIGGTYGIYLLLTRKKGRKEHFAFGPALCAGIALSIFLGQQIITWYLGFF